MLRQLANQDLELGVELSSGRISDRDGSVMAGNAFIRFTSGQHPLFAPAMYDTLGIDWAPLCWHFSHCCLYNTFVFYFVSDSASLRDRQL